MGILLAGTSMALLGISFKFTTPVKAGALYDPEADKAFLKSLRTNLDPSMEVVEADAHINDPIFADTYVSKLIDMLRK